MKKIKSPRYTFQSKEWNDIIGGLDKQTTGPMDPMEEIKIFEQIVKQRGYEFFRPESMHDWLKKYGNVSYTATYEKGMNDAKQFLYSVETLGHPEHEMNRLLFANTFKGSKQEVEIYFIEKAKEEAGENFKPIRDDIYEGNYLKLLVESKHASFEHLMLRSLMKAKWNAVGYCKDTAYKQRFLDDYCVALKEF